MLLHDTTESTDELNLALDEALLLDPERSESLRLWESPTRMVVLGRSSRYQEEVDTEACRTHNASLLRRVSGGLTIVTGPGCLMYAVVLDLKERPEIASIDQAHRWVLDRLAAGLRPLDSSVTTAGTSDLAIRQHGSLLKFSGNSVRLVRDRLLYHGTILYDFDLALVSKLLKTPPRQPDYRSRRPHEEFVTNLPTNRKAITSALMEAWSAEAAPVPEAIKQHAKQLVAEKYSKPAWNLSR